MARPRLEYVHNITFSFINHFFSHCSRPNIVSYLVTCYNHQISGWLCVKTIISKIKINAPYYSPFLKDHTQQDKNRFQWSPLAWGAPDATGTSVEVALFTATSCRGTIREKRFNPCMNVSPNFIPVKFV